MKHYEENYLIESYINICWATLYRWIMTLICKMLGGFLACFQGALLGFDSPRHRKSPFTTPHTCIAT